MRSIRKYKGSARERETKLAAKRDILEIMRIAARMNLQDEKVTEDLLEIKANYDKI